MSRPIQQDYTTNETLEREAARLKLPLHFCWHKDQFPRPVKDGGYILNLADTGNEGSHWCILYRQKDNYAYFDPFGAVPPKIVQQYLPKYLYNSTVIQSPDTGFCGSYCIEFLEYMYKNKRQPFKRRFQSFLNLFSNDFRKNASILRKLEQN